jgi:hypothetical protein
MIAINAEPKWSLSTQSPTIAINAEPNIRYQRRAQHSLSTWSPNNHYQRKSKYITINAEPKSITRRTGGGEEWGLGDKSDYVA